MCPLGEAHPPFFVEMTDPILDTPSGIVPEPPDLRRGHSWNDEEQPVESVVVSGLIGATDLILEGEGHVLVVEYDQGRLKGTSSPRCTRNDL